MSKDFVGRWCAGCLLTAKRAYPLIDPEVAMLDNLADPTYKIAFAKADRVRRGEEKPDFVVESVMSECRVGFRVEEVFDLYDEQQFRARFKCSPLALQAQIEMFVLPSGMEVSGVALSSSGPRRVTTYVTQDRVLHSNHLEPGGHIRQEQGRELHQCLTKVMASRWGKRKSVAELEAAARRVEAMPAQRALVAVGSQPLGSGELCIKDEDEGMVEEVVEAQQDAPALDVTNGRGPLDRSSLKRKAARRRMQIPRRSPGYGDFPAGTVIEGLDSSASGPKIRDDNNSVHYWIGALDVLGIMDGTLSKPGILVRGARLLLTKLTEQGNIGEASMLADHLKVALAAAELPRFKAMQIEELLRTIDVVESGGFQVPSAIGVEVLKAATQPRLGFPSPDADDVLDMLWMWQADLSEPPADFKSRSPKLCDLGLCMLDKVAAFKTCYLDSYLGALIAMGPSSGIETAAGKFLARWDAILSGDDDAQRPCPGREAARGIAPLA